MSLNILTKYCDTVKGYKVSKWTREVMQSDPQQAPNTKGKDKQIQ